MKHVVALCLTLALASTLANAQIGQKVPEQTSLRVLATATPIYPRSLIEIGVSKGTSRVVLDVDEKGTLTDWLVTAYSRREFADSAVAAIKDWKFEPMLLHGQPVPAQVEVLFTFEAGQCVISMDLTTSIMARVAGLMQDGAYRPSRLKELDQIPVPVQAVAPMFPESLMKQGVYGQVVVEFYIDEGGQIRMPAVISADHDVLGSFAIQAVRQWKFEPPLRGGKPALARVRQTFNFARSQS